MSRYVLFLSFGRMLYARYKKNKSVKEIKEFNDEEFDPGSG